MPGVTVERRWFGDEELPDLLGWADALVLPYREASQSGVAALAHRGGPACAGDQCRRPAGTAGRPAECDVYAIHSAPAIADAAVAPHREAIRPGPRRLDGKPVDSQRRIGGRWQPRCAIRCTETAQNKRESEADYK